MHRVLQSLLFFFNATATPQIYTLSLHDALPISPHPASKTISAVRQAIFGFGIGSNWRSAEGALTSASRSEEHTSELQSRGHLVCRLLLEKKKQKKPEQQQPETGTEV